VTLLYHVYDLHHAAIAPFRFMTEATQATFLHPFVPASYTGFGRAVAAGAELMERTTRRFGKPVFGLRSTTIDGAEVAVTEVDAVRRPFGNLKHFVRATERKDPKLLIVAPLSGHYATLLRGTVEALLPHHDVYITDWTNARNVPVSLGGFHLDDYIAYVIDFLHRLGPGTHVLAVCQPAVPVLAAASLMAQANDPCRPLTMTLMGGPIDTTAAKTKVTSLAETKPIGWFERTVVSVVPPWYPGAFRRVYPGFVQLTGFMSMNLDRHVGAHMNLFRHLVRGDGESAESHRTFYDEYMSVMDLPAEFYLETVERVFQRHDFPNDRFMWRGVKVEPRAITDIGLLTVEGELDDISAPGQTAAAHDLCTNIPDDLRGRYLQEKVGHYGIFNGRRWREQIMPRVRDFIRTHDADELSPVA
jgi:poly(3-hydroxybutyrate) depolymerase